jgi:PPOX class probable F420-dependent enzyme
VCSSTHRWPLPDESRLSGWREQVRPTGDVVREAGQMITLNDEVRAALAAGHLAHLVTLNSDGSPQVAIVWVGLDGDDIVSAHLSETQQKLRNVRRDPRVALSLETGGRNEFGLDHYLVVYGRARLEAGGAPELLQRLARVYLGPDVKFPPMDDPPPGVIMRITPDRVAGVGPWN